MRSAMNQASSQHSESGIFSIINMAKALAFWALSILALQAMCFSAKADDTKVPAAILVHQHVQYGQTIKVVGNADDLSNWDYEAAPGLTWNTGDNWVLLTELTKGITYQYKAIVVNTNTNQCNCWQSGNNREFTIPSDFTGDYLLNVDWNPNAEPEEDACTVGDSSCDVGSHISSVV